MGWQLSMTLFGYLHDIVFAGQPAVENYKAWARVLRMQENPLGVLQEWEAQCTDGILTLYGPQGTVSQHQGYTRASYGAKPCQGLERRAHSREISVSRWHDQWRGFTGISDDVWEPSAAHRKRIIRNPRQAAARTRRLSFNRAERDGWATVAAQSAPAGTAT